jgi:uncharacterized protein YcbK (DUF882 family)
MDRRTFLSAMSAALLLPSQVSGVQPLSSGRALTLVRPQSGERLSAVYKRSNGQLDTKAFAEICQLMRDTKADKTAVIDVRLLDILDSIRVALTRVGIANPVFNVHSAFRTWQTNREVGGALQSYHMKGMAIDFHVQGIDTEILFKWMQQVNFHGGVGMGFYGGKPTWMHLDSRKVEKNIVWRG